MPKNPSYAYRLHKPSGQAVVWIDGRDVYLGVYGSPESKEKHRRVIAEHLIPGRFSLPNSPAQPNTVIMPTPAVPAPVPSTDDRHTVDELLAAYDEHAEAYYRKGGAVTSEVASLRSAYRPLSDLFGSTAAADFDAASLELVQQEMIRRDWCRSNINKQVNRIRRIFRWGVLKKIVPAWMPEALKSLPPLEAERSKARESVPVEGVLAAQVEAVLPYLSRQLAAAVRVQMHCGCRPGEVLQMRVKDIKFKGPSGCWLYTPQSHKTQHRGQRRIIPLGVQAQAILKDGWLKPDLEAWIFDAGEAERDRSQDRRTARKTPPYPSHIAAQARKRAKATVDPFAQRPYTREAYARAIARACVLAGVPHWHPHQLRHTAAELIRDTEGDLQAVADALGHADLKSAGRYAPRGLKRACEVMAKLG